MTHHHLHSSPETCHWGYFEARLKPVLTIKSGDEVTVGVHPTGDGRVHAISWEGHGCSISTASASLLSDLVHDTDREALTASIAAFRELMQSKGALDGDEELLGDAVALAGVSRYVTRVKCAMLPWVALEDALLKSA